jgi:cell wall-associated NlpC family hydrolase
VTTVLATASVVPLLDGPSLRAGLVSQLVLGEAATVMTGTDSDFLAVRTMLDDLAGWMHRGYVHLVDDPVRDHWLANTAWSEGAVLEADGVALRAPHRSRVILEGTRIRLPTGASARVVLGSIRPYGEVIRDAQQVSPAEWAWREFAGTPFLWGGTTAAGIDAAALVQNAFLARGVPLPRQAAHQAQLGSAVEPGQARDGDVLCFRDGTDDTISHVALLLPDDRIVHSTVRAGGVIRESWSESARATGLHERLVTIRRFT